MSQPLPLSEEHRDCLQEVCNIAMGAAGESLANFAQVFVNLSIPKIRYIDPKEIPESLSSLQGEYNVSGVVQSFTLYGEETLNGEEAFALVVITEPSFQDLSATAGRVLNSQADAENLLKELSATINRTCLPRLAELMETQLDYSEPDIFAHNIALSDLRLYDIAGWDHVVSIEINYHLENHPFNCDLLLLLPDDMVERLRDALELLLAD